MDLRFRDENRRQVHHGQTRVARRLSAGPGLDATVPRLGKFWTESKVRFRTRNVKRSRVEPYRAVRAP